MTLTWAKVSLSGLEHVWRVCAQVISDPRVAAGKKIRGSFMVHSGIPKVGGFNPASCALAVRIMKPCAVNRLQIGLYTLVVVCPRDVPGQLGSRAWQKLSRVRVAV